jgi:hypothetical protein
MQYVSSSTSPAAPALGRSPLSNDNEVFTNQGMVERPRLLHMVLVAGVCAAIVVLTWFLAQEQAELARLRAAAAQPTNLTLIIADSPAHATCERIDNNSDSPLVISLRANPTADGPGKPVSVKVAAHGSTDVCVDYRALTGG